MLEYREIPDTNIVEFVIDGAISAAEFDEVIGRFEASIARHAKIRVLEHVRSLGGIPPSKWWEDVKFGFKHMRDIDRAAVVGDQKWIEVFANLVNPFFSAEVRYFTSANIEQARVWLREPEDAGAESPGVP
jgi:SpoIIAA-like